jgi:hypothetical protein
MRQAKYLHPEWGILAPPPGFARAMRILVIAAAVGATAGSGVILSLVDRTPAVARTLPMPAAAPAQPRSAPLMSALVRSRGVIESEPAKTTPSMARTKPVAHSPQLQKKVIKKNHAGPRYASHGRQLTSLMDEWYHAVGL